MGETKRIYDGDLGQMLGDWEWQYDLDAVTDMLSEYDYETGQRFWLGEGEMPDWEEFEAAAQWAPVWENVEHVLDWYNERAETTIWEVDDASVFDALTEVSDDGNLVWKDLRYTVVEDIIYDNALLTSENVGDIHDADDIGDENLNDLWDVFWWADLCPLPDDPDEEGLRTILDRLTDVSTSGFRTWKRLTRNQIRAIVKEPMR